MQRQDTKDTKVRHEGQEGTVGKRAKARCKGHNGRGQRVLRQDLIMWCKGRARRAVDVV